MHTHAQRLPASQTCLWLGQTGNCVSPVQNKNNNKMKNIKLVSPRQNKSEREWIFGRNRSIKSKKKTQVIIGSKCTLCTHIWCSIFSLSSVDVCQYLLSSPIYMCMCIQHVMLTCFCMCVPWWTWKSMEVGGVKLVMRSLENRLHNGVMEERQFVPPTCPHPASREIREQFLFHIWWRGPWNSQIQTETKPPGGQLRLPVGAA